MSTKLGTLTLDLVAKIGNFTGPIKEGEKQVKLSFDNMRKHINTYGAVAVAGAAAVGAGVFAMANEYSNAAREVQTFAQIAKAGNEEFQKLAVGANTVGISQEKLSGQLKDFNEKLGEFITIGSGGAVDFFEQIAIKTEGSAKGARQLALEMQNLSGPQALQLYVDKLEEAGVTQQQMSFYLESMASDTTNLIPLLRNGGEGFKYWADAAERAGAIMDEHAIAKANELRVQMDLLSLQVQGAKNQFIQGLMPAIVSVGGAMSDATVETNMMADAGETLGEVFKGVAVVGMGVYATIKMISNAIAGLSFDAANAKKNVEMAKEDGNWLDKFPGIKWVKTALITSATMGSESSGISMAAADNKKVAEDVAAAIESIYGDATNKAVKAMAELQSGQNGVIKGSDEWIKKQDEASRSAAKHSKATSDAAKALREYNQAIDLAKRLIYEYGDEQQRIQLELQDDLLDIEAAALSANAKSRYSSLAEMQAEAKKKAYVLELEHELNAHRKTEEEKLNDEILISKLRLDAKRGLNENELQLRKQSLDDQFRLEMFYIEQSKLARAQNASTAWGGTFSDITGTSDSFALEQERFSRYDESQELFDAQMVLAETAAEREAIWQAHHDRMALIESDYHRSSIMLGVSAANETLGGLTDLMGSMLGEQSTAYKAMFAMQKGFAIAQAVMNAPATYSNVYTSVSAIPLIGPYIAPVMAGAAVATQIAQASQIKSMSLSGMAHDGIDSIPKEGTWLLDKGERVVDARTNGDLKDFLKSGNSGIKIYINNNTGAQVNARQNADGSVTIDLVERMIQSAFGRVARANSDESQIFQQTFNLSVAR